MSLHPARSVLSRTLVDLELDLEDCPGFSVRSFLVYGRLSPNILVYHCNLCHVADTHSLTCRHMAC